ncbi:hypothetical protein IH779_02400 [Patescibacteria group bacterium]|nr:hypothetical protein [Patescibacteria group bacterium]
MKFNVTRAKENILALARKLGYRPLSKTEEEFTCVRFLASSEYPRFHLYIKENKDELLFNLHLDQKKPTYAGSKAHSGEYTGAAVEREAERIKKILES